MNESLTTPGTHLMGKYRIEKVLGQGAMGVVVAAAHLGFGTQVAMKLMLSGKGSDAERHERFLQEARIAARLTSAHAGKVLDVGRLEGTETPYLGMEYLEGRDLDALLEEGGVLPFSEAVGYVLQVCEPVAELRRRLPSRGRCGLSSPGSPSIRSGTLSPQRAGEQHQHDDSS